MNNIIKEILELKKEKNAVILAHCYQNVEIDEVADYVGDSLYLSQMAAKTDADVIVFAGVYFMAETAKILSPDKKVLLPRKESGCNMADMINLVQLREFKSKNPNIPVVCYVNSTAEVKSECDICCTSSNAVKVVESLCGSRSKQVSTCDEQVEQGELSDGDVRGLEQSDKNSTGARGADKVLFCPDTYLGKWVESKLNGVEVITYPGFCPTHLRVKPEDVLEKKKQYPEALVLVHPECHQAVTALADYVGSTTGIMNFAMKSDKKQFIIVTEKGVVDRLERDCKNENNGKEFILASEKLLCQNMKWNQLEDILNALKYEQYEISVDEEIAKKAVTCIDKMLEVSL